MTLSPRLLVPLLATCAVVAVRCAPRGEAEIRVVLITLDTLRMDAFLGSADRPSQMPRLWEWAKRGRVLERYYSATSSTQPSHATLFTGLHPWEHGVPRNGMVLVDERVTLAERLKDAGFRTAAVVASFPLHGQFGFDQGFDTYHDRFKEDGPDEWSQYTVPAARFRSNAKDVTRTALEQLNRARGSKQFFWFHYFDAHSPYGGSTGSQAELTAPKMLTRIAGGADVEHVQSKARRLYHRDVGYLDEAVARVLVRLHEREESETHVVVVSDHGESFGEEGSVGHGKRLTTEQIRVPCFVLSPKVRPGISAEPVGTTDLTTTILSLAGVALEPPGGRDLLDPEAKPAPIVGMRRTFETPYHERRTDGSVHVHDGLRFYVLDGEDLVTGGGQGAITRNDSAEELTDPERIAGARSLFRGFEQTFAAQMLHSREDPETLEKLRALGYVR